MSKWKPIGELKNSHTGYAWLRHQECLSEGWKNPDGYLGYAHGEVDLGQSPTHWMPGVNMEGYIPVRPTVKAGKPKKSSKWVRVEDRKPDHTGYILLFDCGIVRYGFKSEGGCYYADSEPNRQLNPTHWRPLPKGPKDE